MRLTVYRIIDPATGLIWTGNVDHEAKKYFSEQGAEYKCTLEVAQKRHRTYKALREVLTHLPETVLVEEQITLTETGRFTEEYDDESMEDYRYVARHGKDSRLVRFARHIRHLPNRDEFKFIVKRRREDEFPLKLIGKVLHPSNKLGGEQSELLAVTNETDLIFLRLAMEGLKAYNRITGKPVFS